MQFDSTVTHRFGDAVVMFSHYAIVTEKAGQRPCGALPETPSAREH